MTIIQNIYYYFRSFFEFLTLRRKSSDINLNDIENSENDEEYEFLIFNDRVHQKMSR
jgi:hypothetical protein